MTRRSLIAVLTAAGLPGETSEHPIPAIRAALARQYNFDFSGAHRILDGFIDASPSHPLGHTFRASAHLFHELDRLRVLESEFLSDDDRIKEDKKEEPDPSIRELFFQSIDRAQRAAALSAPASSASLFALCLTEGMKLDYVALIDKRQLRSLSHARQAQAFAVQLLKADPSFVDARLTAGVSEYVLGSLPFFLRWFVRFPEAEGSKQKAIENLSAVARSGYYLGPFARILLAIVYLREKRPQDALRLLEMLTAEFPENPLLRTEHDKLRKKYPLPALRPRPPA